MQSYTFEEKNQQNVVTTLKSIKEKVETKLILLINYVYNDSRKEFMDCLRIIQENEETQALWEHLKELKDEIINYNEDEVPENLLEDFAQTLLSTNKLVEQINKLIIKNFS
jgi:hypothetical protein